MKCGIFYLPIETSSRELPSRLLISKFLTDRGGVVIVGPTGALRSLARKIPGVYLHKRHTLGDLDLIAQLTTSGNIVVALDEEALIGAPNGDWANSSADSRVLNLISAVFLNSEHHFLSMQNVHPGFSKRFVLSGNPRVELASPALRHFRRLLSPKSVPKEPFILIATNFSSGNISRSYGMSALKQRQLLNSVFGEDKSAADRASLQIEALVSRDRMLMHSYSLAVRQLANRNRAMKFVVRPHPTEDLISWRKLFRGLGNVRVVREGTALAFIEKAICLIHPDSTTSYEASLVGVPSIRFLPDIRDQVLAKKVGNNSEQAQDTVTSVDHLQVRIAEILAGPGEVVPKLPSIKTKASPSEIIGKKMLTLQPQHAGKSTSGWLCILAAYYSLRLEFALGFYVTRKFIERLLTLNLVGAHLVGADHTKFPWLKHRRVLQALRALEQDTSLRTGRGKPSLLSVGPRTIVLGLS